MIVVDASAAITALLSDGTARVALGDEQVHVPHLIDTEIASGLRGRVLARKLDEGPAWNALDTWRRLAMTRYAMFGVLDRVWQLRASLSAYDACYIALAEHLGCTLLTADVRLARAPGRRCPVTVVPG